jgi:hypothetical protein
VDILGFLNFTFLDSSDEEDGRKMGTDTNASETTKMESMESDAVYVPAKKRRAVQKKQVYKDEWGKLGKF